MKPALRVILPALLLAAGCTPPVAPSDKPVAPRSTRSPDAGAALAKACGDAAGKGQEASAVAKEGRFLRAAVLLDQAEALCPKRDPAVIGLHAEALAEIGRCAGVRRLAAAAGRSVDFKKAEATCAERTRGIGDAAAEDKSRALAREGQQTFRRGDLALAERLAAQALGAAATGEALLLDARVQSVKGDKKRARQAFDRAFAAFERGGEASVLVIPHAAMTASREDGSQVAVADKRLWISRSDTPDRVTTMAWADAANHGGYRNTQGIAVTATGRFLIAGLKNVILLDIETARILDSLPEEGPSLRVLEGGRRALVFKRGDPDRTDFTKLVDLTDPARLKVIQAYEGGSPDDALDGSAFLIKNDAGIRVIDAATGKAEAEFEKAASGIISSDGKLVALCEVSPPTDFSGSVETELILFDRVKNRARWTKHGACFPTSPMSFGYKDRTIYSIKNLHVKNGAEALDDVEPPAAETPKAGSVHWLAAGFNENAIGCTRALSGDGALVLAGCYSDVGVYETRTGKRLFKSDKPITLLPRGPIVATESALCDVRSAACLSLATHCKKGNMTFSTDGARILCASEEGLREITWDDSLAIKTNRVFPGSKPWLPVFFGPRGAGAMRMSAAAIELLFLDFDKGSATSAGRPPGVLLSPDGGFTISATNGEPAVFNYVTGKNSALRGHAGAIAAPLVSRDGHFVGLKDPQQTWRFWAMPEGRLLGRFDALDRPKSQPDEPMLLSGTMGLTAQLLSTGYIAGALGAQNHWQLNLTQGFWLAPISDPTKILEVRWTGTGGYFMETLLGSRALGKSRVAILGEGTSLVACGFGDGVVAPLEVCREAFVFNELAEGAFASISP